jgi:phosphoribosylformimino-5-aminoimidazole carboxamide ribotide isomerase
MEIIPAIDLREGRCVRLYQGDYAEETVFSRDPLEVALRWQSMGAPRLHVVDLDGAAIGEICNLEVIKQIVQAVLVPVELGGGIRDLHTVEQLLKIGVDRIIIGTAALETPDLVKEACRVFRESVIIGVDAREGKLAIHGWRQQTETTATELIRSMIGLGARRFI